MPIINNIVNGINGETSITLLFNSQSKKIKEISAVNIVAEYNLRNLSSPKSKEEMKILCALSTEMNGRFPPVVHAGKQYF